MVDLQPDVVSTLRRMALGGSKPSEMLQMIISRHRGEVLTRDVFPRYFGEAFCFRETGAGPLWGWLPDGTGELQDADIDSLLPRRIEQTRAEWEKRTGGS